MLSSDNGKVLPLAAIGGRGITLLSEPTVRSDIAAGALVQLLPNYRFAVRGFSNGIYARFGRAGPCR